MKRSDEELVQLAKSGDQDAYTALYNGSRRSIGGVVFRMLRSNPDDVDDVIQEIMLRAFRGLERFNGESSFKTWLHRIAINTALMKIRSYKTLVMANAQPLEYEDSNGEAVTVDVPDEERGYRQFEARHDLNKILNNMPHNKTRMAMELRYLWEMSGDEIAERMGAGIPAAKSNIQRGLEKARSIMDEMNLPIEKRQCQKCKDEGRFRFADRLIEGVPLCKWCDAGVPTTNHVAITQKSRNCLCCGVAFIPTGNRQVYAAGHKPKVAKAITKHKARSFPAQPKPFIDNYARVERVEPETREEIVSISVSAKALDSMWRGLQLKDKARAFEFLLKE